MRACVGESQEIQAFSIICPPISHSLIMIIRRIRYKSYKKSAFATVAADSLSRLVSFYMTMTSSVFSPWSYFYIPAEGIWVFALNGAKTQVARGHILRNG